MSADRGGPAFPAPDLGEEDFGQRGAYPGMTLRDYFMAHAPAEPQPWFEPTMPHPRPKHPTWPDFTREQCIEYEGWKDFGIPPEDLSPPVAAYARELISWRIQSRAWDSDHLKQRYVQWPAAWADAMLKARLS